MKTYWINFPPNSWGKGIDTSGGEFALKTLQNSGFAFHWTFPLLDPS